MEIKLLPCPVCSHHHFDNVDVLRTTLVRVATSLVTCPVCFETLLGLDKLTIHLFSHITERTNDSVQLKPEIHKIQRETDSKIDVECEGPVKCDICSYSFEDRHILDIHQKLLHQTPTDDKTGTYSYHCHLCSKKFKMRGSLMVHLRVAHYGFVHKQTICEKKSSIKMENEDAGYDYLADSTGSEKHLQGKCQDNKQWECDVCAKLFTTKYFLKKHKRLHTGEMPYCCTLCNKSFTFQQSYHKHMLYHSSEKPHVCNECGRAFKELSTLQNHARIHSGERPFICETCGKSFRQRVSYLVHRRIHTGVMPYKCATCDKSFRYKVSQKSHKCLANNLEAVDNDSAQQSTYASKCIMNVDFDTGNISVVPQKQNEVQVNSNVLVQKKSILLNNNELIEITYNKEDLLPAANIIVEGVVKEVIDENNEHKVGNCGSQDEFEKLIYTEPEKGVFSPMANLLPEVESLYLNNSPTNGLQLQDREDETIIDMRDKCLEELLKAIE